MAGAEAWVTPGMASSAMPLGEALRTLEDMFADIDPRVRCSSFSVSRSPLLPSAPLPSPAPHPTPPPAAPEPPLRLGAPRGDGDGDGTGQASQVSDVGLVVPDRPTPRSPLP